MTILRNICVLAIVWPFILFSQNSALACSCFIPPLSVQRIVFSDVCFEGVLICIESVHITLDPKYPPYEHYKYTFEICDLIRGEHHDDEIEIYSGLPTGGDCSAYFSMNENYIVFSTQRSTNGYLYTSTCHGNFQRRDGSERFSSIFSDYTSANGMRSWHNYKGDLVARGEVTTRNPVGEWVFYHPDGSIAATGMFNNGLMDCTWNYYLSRQASRNAFNKMTARERADIRNPNRLLIRIEEYDLGDLIWKESWSYPY